MSTYNTAPTRGRHGRIHMTASWTRDRRSGNWVALVALAKGEDAPESGDTITVRKRDGSSRDIEADSVSRPFTGKFGPAKGKQCVFVTPYAERRSYGNGYGGNGNSNVAPGGRRCDYCGSRECSRAWNPHDLCDED